MTAGAWIWAERVSARRQQEAEQRTVQNAVRQDLSEMNQRLKEPAWPEARAAKERATGRLGKMTADDLTRAIGDGSVTLSLVADLESIRLNGHERLMSKVTHRSAARRYEQAFRAAGFTGLYGDPEILASQVRSSQISSALIAALDHWSESTDDAKEAEWVLEVARRADRDTSRWRTEARDPSIRSSESELVRLINEVPVQGQPIPLLLAIEMRLQNGVDERIAFLKRLQRAHPDDFWVNVRLASVLQQCNRSAEAISYLEAANALRPRTPIVLNNLGQALFSVGRREESIERYRETIEVDPQADAAHANLISALWNSGRTAESLRQIELSESICSESGPFLMMKGQILHARGLIQEAEETLRRGSTIDPSWTAGTEMLLRILLLQGKADEACELWRQQIETSPRKHSAYYGYAEYCAFTERHDEYLTARTALLREFGTTELPHIAERTSRACLLKPVAGEELQIASSLADRAVAAGVAGRMPALRHFYFAQGLARYRHGDFQGAITTVKGDASTVLGPAPRLILAMALFRTGEAPSARETLNAAITSFDWDVAKAVDQDAWICHVLRREAEDLINARSD